MLTLVLGGARSGKSRYAQSLCEGGPAVYVATASATGPGRANRLRQGYGESAKALRAKAEALRDVRDREMQQRIERHRRDRPAAWTTVEEPHDVASAVIHAQPADAPVMVDCVTVWIANLLWTLRDAGAEEQESAVLQAAQDLAGAGRKRSVIAVSNEVGGGTVPGHPTARTFRDLHGLANQLLAREAERVVLVVAGLPVVLKG